RTRWRQTLGEVKDGFQGGCTGGPFNRRGGNGDAAGGVVVAVKPGRIVLHTPDKLLHLRKPIHQEPHALQFLAPLLRTPAAPGNESQRQSKRKENLRACFNMGAIGLLVDRHSNEEYWDLH